MDKRRILKLLILGISIMALSLSCATGDSTDSKSDLTKVTLLMSDAEAIPQDLEFLDLIVTGPGIDKMKRRIVLSDLMPEDSPKFEISVPAGKNRTFAITATNKDGYVAYEGEETVDLIPGVRKDLQVFLYGRGYIYGNVYWLDPLTAQVEGPLADHQQTSGEVLINTDVSGAYETKLGTRLEPYEISIDVASAALKDVAQDFEAFANVYLTSAGKRVKVDFYLIPKDDYSRPWICAMLPDTASVGDDFLLFGRGFDPVAPFLNPTIIFDPHGAAISADDQTALDNEEFSATVPPLAQTGDVVVSWSGGAVYSNVIPFSLLP